MFNSSEYSLAFRAWLETPLGRSISFVESEVVTSALTNLCGYQATVLGEPQFVQSIQHSHFKTTSIVNLNLGKDLPIPAICARLDKLPIESEAMDCVYLAHCLEFSNNPHEVLREVHRILRPDGQIIISIFNPLSLWGIWRSVAKISSKDLWRANFMSPIKLKDWLALLGFDIMRINHFGFCLPLQVSGTTTKLRHVEKYCQKLNLPCGAAYTIAASKRIIPITPIKPVWEAEQQVAVRDAAEPTV